MRPDPAKIEKVQRYPTPTDATQVRQFLGLASYYRRFMPAFAKVSAPLLKADVHRHCRSCLVCTSRKESRRTFKPLLQPIQVGGPFHRLAVDILKLPLTSNGNRYVAVFMDYLTKLPEAFAIPDQKAETIATLFIKHIVCRHGIPEELLTDRGANFLSSLIQEICRILGVQKINTSGYHPQTDGLVE